jgi:AraC family transcriptional regulator of adaptative response/methylated-DNA-[protein]-cysteine methyltransferase
MSKQEEIDFMRIKRAIEYLDEHHRAQPDLDEVAAYVHLSPYHFQRLFKEWAGVSPKRFLQFISAEYAKGILLENQSTLFDTAYEIGLSGTGRLHDLFIRVEGMTPGEYKNGGENLSVNYSFASSPFGKIIIASTPKGICHISFNESEQDALDNLKSFFPKADYHNSSDQIQQKAVMIFTGVWQQPEKIKLHIRGTGFQLKVWETLLRIPLGQLATYTEIARFIDNPAANRAVGSAVGANPVAYLIPCHRVIQSTGAFGQYRWGRIRKTAMIGWENAMLNKEITAP